MKKRNSRILRKLIASALVLLMVAAPVTPLGSVIGIDAGITADAYVYETVNTAAELDNALSSGGNYILGQDITWTYDTYPVVAPGKTVRLNLGGHTLDIQSNEITSYGTLTIEGEGTITGNPYWRLIVAYADGSAGVVNLVSDDVTYNYTNRNALLDSGSGTINVSGGNFVSSSALYSGYGRIIITGGTFNKDPSDKVPAGYKVRSVDGTYTVSPIVNATADFSSITNAPSYIKVKNANGGAVVMSSIAGTNQYTCNLSDDYTVTSPYRLDFVGADVEEEKTDTGWTYTMTSVNEANVTVTKHYQSEGTWWGFTTTGTLELFGQMPNQVPVLNNSPFYSFRSNITEVVALPGATAGTSLELAFSVLQNAASIDLSELDTSSVTNMYSTFENCASAVTIDVSTWDTSSVTNMAYMFSGCSALTTLDVRKWNTACVTRFSHIFNACEALETLDVSNWVTSNGTAFDQAFSNMTALRTLDIGGWNLSGVSSSNNVNAMFNNDSALESITLPGLHVSEGFVPYNFSFYRDNSLKQITFTSDYEITSQAYIPNGASEKFAQGWYDEDGELVSGTGDRAVMQGEAGTVRRTAGNIATAEITGVSDAIYTGEEIKPTVTVKVGDKELTENTDYTVSYADNTDIGTATVTVTAMGECIGEQEVEFDIAATLTVPEDVTATVYKNKTTVADTIDDTVVIKEGYYILSDKQLFFDDTQVDIKEYKPGDNNHPFKSNATLKTKYCYRVDQLFDNVVATHSHIYVLQTADSKLNVRCEGEPGGYETIAEITIPEANYEYGDKVDIETKSYDVSKYDVKKTDITFDDIIFITTSGLTEDMPTALGTYTAKAQPYFSKTDLTYGLTKNFVIGKKDIAELVKLSNGQSTDGTNKDDHIEIKLVDVNEVEQTDGSYVTDENGKLFKIMYNNKAYTPVIKLVNYVYDYTEKKYIPEEVTDDNYTAVLTPQTDAGTYTVTITAKNTSVNYKGEGTFNWDITKRNFTDLSITDNRAEGDDDPDDEFTDPTYTGVAVKEADFTVKGLNTISNPGTLSGNTFTYKWYKLKEDAEVAEGTELANIPADDFEEMGQDERPTDAGKYRVEVTVQNKNYNDGTVSLNFEIAKKEIVITPSEENNITYGEFVYGEEFVDGEFAPRELKWTADLPADGAEIGEGEVQLLVVMDRDDDGEPIYAEEDDILDAGEYDYEFSTDVPESQNYTFKLDPEVKFVVGKKELTKEMFTVDPLELTYNGENQVVEVTGSDSRINPFVEPDPESPYEVGAVVDLLSSDGDDWTVFNKTNEGTDAGTYTVQIVPTENGNYKLPAEGTVTVIVSDNDVTVLPLDLTEEAQIGDGPSAVVDIQRWTIAPLSVDELTIEAEDLVYNASKQTATVTVTYNGEPLGADDYDLVIASGTKVGDYAYTVTGKGNFTGTKEGTWAITPADFKSVSIYGGNKTYDGEAVTADDFKVTIKLLDAETDKTAYKNTLNTNITFTADEEGLIPVNAPTKAGTYYANVTVHDPAGNYKDYTVPTVVDGDVVKPAYKFTIKKRKVELYPKENQSAPAGSDYTIDYTYEKAMPETITGVMPADEAGIDFSAALKLDQSGNTPGFYEIVLDEAVAANAYDNYIPYLEDSIDFELTKAPLQKEWFKLVYDTEQQPDVEVDGYVFDGNMVKVKLVPTDAAPDNLVDNGNVNTAQVTVSGVTSSFLPEGTFNVYVKANKNGDYKDPAEGVLTYTWKINPVQCDAEVSVQENNLDLETSGGYESGYYYNGRTPNIDIISKNDDTPLPENAEKTYTYYKGVRNAETGEVSYGEDKLADAPVNAGFYKADGEVDAKGFKVNSVDPAEFEIKQRILFVTISQKDLYAFYNPSGEYSIHYTEYDLDNSKLIDSGEGTPFGYIDSEKKMAPHIVGDLGLITNSADGSINAGDELTVDTSGLKVQFGDNEKAISENYRVVVQVLNEDGVLRYIDVESQPKVTVVPAPIRENWIVFDAEGGEFNKYDIKPTEVSFKVYYNGDVNTTALSEGYDYEVAGELSNAEESESYIVQVKGLNNYTYYAEKAWSVAYDEDERNEHVAAMTDPENANYVAVEIIDDYTVAKHASGMNRIYVTAQSSKTSDDVTITKTGLIAVPKAVYESEGFDPDSFVVGGEGVTTVGRANATQYRYGLVDETGEGLYVKAYAIANDGEYETIVYTNEKLVVFDDYIRYTVSVVDGTGAWTSDKQEGYGTEPGSEGFTGSFVKTEKPLITATAVDKSADGLKFAYWLKNGVVASYNEEYSFRLAGKSVELEAVFVESDEDIEIEPVLTMTAIKTTYNGKNAIGFVFEHNVPSSKYAVTTVGVHYATNKLAGADTTKEGYALVDLTDPAVGEEYGVPNVEQVIKAADNGKVKNYVANYVNNNGKVEVDYALGANVDAFAYAVGYIVATNLETSETETLYSNLIATTINKCS